MKRRRPKTMSEKIASIVAGPLVDAMHINVWSEGTDGEPRATPGRQVELKYHRADGRPMRRRRKAGAS